MRICGSHIVLLALTTLTLAACGDDEEFNGSNGGANLPPIIAGTPITTLSAGTAYSFTPTAADPDGDAITFRATNVPGWAAFSTATGSLTGTPTEANVGMTEMITIEVTDSQAITQLPPFRIQVSSNATTPPPPVNVAPTITGIPGTTATVGTAYTFAPVGADANGDTLTYSVQNLPGWLTFAASTGRLTGTPATANIGTTSNIVITVSDGQASSSLASFNLQVVAAPTTPPPNRAPTITGNPATSVTAGVAYAFNPVGSDPDGNTLSYTIQNRPSWAQFSATTGRLSGTPATANVGTSARITITVSDGALSASLPSFTIQVNAPANRAPVISGSPLTSVTVSTAYSFQPSASDPDGNALTFSIQNRPAWANFNTATGTLSGTPAAGDVGSHANIIITVSDGTALTSLPAFAINVVQASTGNAALSWNAPTTHTDGSTLTGLAGFRIVYGRSATTLDQSATINNPSISTYTVQNLASGTWYFAVAAYTSSGGESEFSTMATKIVP
jgi:hypothetical protein